MDTIKRTFGRICGRGRKKRERNSTLDASNRPSDHPPQLPPLPRDQRPIDFTDKPRTPQTPQRPINADKPLPPTHPLATGTHSQPPTAVPLKRTSESSHVKDRETGGTGTTGSIKTTTEGESVKDSGNTAETIAGPVPAAVPANTVEDDDIPPPPPPKADSVDPLKADEHPDARKETIAHTIPVSNQENTLNHRLPSAQPAQPATLTAITNRPNSSEEKVYIDHIPPPPIHPKQFAPGMSATSGPLEDFFPEADEIHNN